MRVAEQDLKVNREHDIRSKLNIGADLTQREESYYLLFMATQNERCQYIQNKKKGVTDATTRTNY